MRIPSLTAAGLGLVILASPAISAETVRNGRTVLLTTAESGGGDSVCQASPFNERACNKAQRQYEKEVRQINKEFDKKVEQLEDKRDRKLERADSADEKDEIRAAHRDNIENARDRRDRKLERAQEQL